MAETGTKPGHEEASPESNGSFESAVRSFVTRELMQGEDARELTDTFHLVEGGVVDSINVLKLVDFIEETYDIMVEPTDIRHFITIANIGHIIRARVAGEPIRLG